MTAKVNTNKFDLLAPVLTDKCLRNHSRVYHLSHRIDNCISEEKVCLVDFQKVLKPIKFAINISHNDKNTILEIRKRNNNKKAASEFRKRESDSGKRSEREIIILELQSNQLRSEREELERDIQRYRSMSVPYDLSESDSQTDSEQEIDVITHLSPLWHHSSF